MRRFRNLLALTLLAAGAALAQQAGYPAIVTDKILYADHDFRGKKMPAFYVEKWLNAKSVDIRGKVLLIDFWATWCGPCRELIPELNAWQKKYAGKLLVIGLSNEPAQTVTDFLANNRMDYSVGIDTKRHMMDQIGIKGIPHVMLISPDGIVRWQGFPGSDEDRLTDKVIDQVIAASGVK